MSKADAESLVEVARKLRHVAKAVCIPIMEQYRCPVEVLDGNGRGATSRSAKMYGRGIVISADIPVPTDAREVRGTRLCLMRNGDLVAQSVRFKVIEGIAWWNATTKVVTPEEAVIGFGLAEIRATAWGLMIEAADHHERQREKYQRLAAEVAA